MIEGYKKLINDLKLHRKFLETYTAELGYNKELFNEAQRPNTRITINSKPIDSVIDDINYYGHLVDIEANNVDRLQAQIKAIDEIIDLSDITIKVGRLRALGMTQDAIAEEMNISDRHVRRIEKQLRES
jgi:DNA-directed RNA polymerase specialized sigma subunit